MQNLTSLGNTAPPWGENKPYTAKYDRFDLEDALIQLYQTTEDIKLVYNNIDGMDEDQLANIILGVMELSDRRIAAAMDIFEDLVNGRVIQ